MAPSKLAVHASAVRSAAPASREEDRALIERCRQGDAAAFEQLYRAHAGKLFSLTCRMVGHTPDAEDLLQDIFLVGAPQARLVPRRVGARHVALSAGVEPVPRPPAQPRRPHQPGHRFAGRRAVDSGCEQPRPGGADGEQDGSRSRDRAAAGRLPRRVRAARRRRPGARRGRRGARHRRRHLEVAGAQGAHAPARAAARDADRARTTRIWPARDTKTRFTSWSTARWDRSAGPSCRSISISATTAGRCCATCERIRDLAAHARSSGAARIGCGCRSPVSCSRKDACRRRRRRRARARHRYAAAGDCRGARADGRRVARLSAAARARRPARHRMPRSHRAPAPGNAAAAGSVQGDIEAEFRQAEQHYQAAIAKLEEAAKSDQNAIDPADRGDAPEEPPGDRSGDRREPRGVPERTDQRAGPRQPVRGAQAEGLAAPGHARADERDAQGQRRRAPRRSSTAPTRADHAPRAPRGGADTSHHDHEISIVPIRRLRRWALLAALPASGQVYPERIPSPARVRREQQGDRQRQNRTENGPRGADRTHHQHRPHRRQRRARPREHLRRHRTSRAAPGPDAIIEIVKTARGAVGRRGADDAGAGAGGGDRAERPRRSADPLPERRRDARRRTAATSTSR